MQSCASVTFKGCSLYATGIRCRREMCKCMCACVRSQQNADAEQRNLLEASNCTPSKKVSLRSAAILMYVDKYFDYDVSLLFCSGASRVLVWGVVVLFRTLFLIKHFSTIKKGESNYPHYPPAYMRSWSFVMCFKKIS